MANYGRLLVLQRSPDHPFWSCGHARLRGRAGSPYRPCPACAALYRRNSRHWSALALVVAGLLLIAGSCSATASSCPEARP